MGGEQQEKQAQDLAETHVQVDILEADSLDEDENHGGEPDETPCNEDENNEEYMKAISTTVARDELSAKPVTTTITIIFNLIIMFALLVHAMLFMSPNLLVDFLTGTAAWAPQVCTFEITWMGWNLYTSGASIFTGVICAVCCAGILVSSVMLLRNCRKRSVENNPVGLLEWIVKLSKRKPADSSTSTPRATTGWRSIPGRLKPYGDLFPLNSCLSEILELVLQFWRIKELSHMGVPFAYSVAITSVVMASMLLTVSLLSLPDRYIWLRNGGVIVSEVVTDVAISIGCSSVLLLVNTSSWYGHGSDFLYPYLSECQYTFQTSAYDKNISRNRSIFFELKSQLQTMIPTDFGVALAFAVPLVSLFNKTNHFAHAMTMYDKAVSDFRSAAKEIAEEMDEEGLTVKRKSSIIRRYSQKPLPKSCCALLWVVALSAGLTQIILLAQSKTIAEAECGANAPSLLGRECEAYSVPLLRDFDGCPCRTYNLDCQKPMPSEADNVRMGKKLDSIEQDQLRKTKTVRSWSSTQCNIDEDVLRQWDQIVRFKFNRETWQENHNRTLFPWFFDRPNLMEIGVFCDVDIAKACPQFNMGMPKQCKPDEVSESCAHYENSRLEVLLIKRWPAVNGILPKEIALLKELRSLAFLSSEIKTVPEEFGAKSKLRLIDLSLNKLSSVPEALLNNRALHTFWALGDSGAWQVPPLQRTNEPLVVSGTFSDSCDTRPTIQGVAKTCGIAPTCCQSINGKGINKLLQASAGCKQGLYLGKDGGGVAPPGMCPSSAPLGTCSGTENPSGKACSGTYLSWKPCKAGCTSIPNGEVGGGGSGGADGAGGIGGGGDGAGSQGEGGGGTTQDSGSAALGTCAGTDDNGNKCPEEYSADRPCPRGCTTVPK